MNAKVVRPAPRLRGRGFEFHNNVDEAPPGVAAIVITDPSKRRRKTRRTVRLVMVPREVVDESIMIFYLFQYCVT